MGSSGMCASWDNASSLTDPQQDLAMKIAHLPKEITPNSAPTLN